MVITAPGAQASRARTAEQLAQDADARGMQGGSLDAPENGGASSSSSPGNVVEPPGGLGPILTQATRPNLCLLYTSDAADE